VTATPTSGTGPPASFVGEALDALRSRYQTHEQATFVSDLSVGELVLLEEVGYRPVDIVSGAGSASWYLQFTTAGTEADIWADAIAASIGAARETIRSETARRGADGVVAMRLELEREPANLLTCTMLGTAVRAVTGSGRAHKGASAPFTTTLSARDFHLLSRAGYSAAGIVIGTSVVGFGARTASQSLGIARDNVELQSQTNALYSAREKAMDKLEREAIAVGADGVVAVEISERPVNTIMAHAVELLVIGTAVCRGEHGHQSIEPTLQLSYDDPDPQVFQSG
jgi:uncharacterized protein YbjQ (UPF0145 family)